MNKAARAIRKMTACMLCVCLLTGCAGTAPAQSDAGSGQSAVASQSAAAPGSTASSAAQIPDEPLPPIEEKPGTRSNAF